MTAKKKPDVDPMVAVLEAGVKKVIEDEESAPADVVKAIEAGTKLYLAKHKAKEGNDDEHYFS